MSQPLLDGVVDSLADSCVIDNCVQNLNVVSYGPGMDWAGTACLAVEPDYNSPAYHEDFGSNLIDILDTRIEVSNSNGHDCAEPATQAIFEHISPLDTTVKVFRECIAGTCGCIYYLGDVRNQLKPCRFASILNLCELGVSPMFVHLLDNILDGFPIVDSEVQPYFCENYNSILQPGNREAMCEIIKREWAEGIITRVYSEPHCVHALGAVPKAGGGMRPITDCSRPTGISVNNFCSSLFHEFKYKSVDDVVGYMSEGDFMSVIDIKSAYRAVSIRESHRKYVGFKWNIEGEDMWFVDNRMCFGLRLGPQYFDQISNLICLTLIECCSLRMVNYLDDFIVIANCYSDCVKAQNVVISALRYLGFHISYGKVSDPSRCTVYLGIEIDSVAMELRLPEGKLLKLIDLLDMYIERKRISKHDLECIGGLLSHCAHVVRGGRIFCRRIFQLYKLMCRDGKRYVKLPDEVKGDLVWWRQFCRVFNGKSKINNQLFDHPMVSDSSFKGYGVYLGADWLAGSWSDTEIIPLNSDCEHIGTSPQLSIALDTTK